MNNIDYNFDEKILDLYQQVETIKNSRFRHHGEITRDEKKSLQKIFTEIKNLKTESASSLSTRNTIDLTDSQENTLSISITGEPYGLELDLKADTDDPILNLEASVCKLLEESPIALNDAQQIAKADFLFFYQELMGDFPNLILDFASLNGKLDAFLQLTDDVEFNPYYADTLIQHFSSLNSSENTEFAKELLNDILLFGCLTPVQKGSSKKLERHCIEVISADKANHICLLLRTVTFENLKDNPSFSHINMEEYQESSLHQKMMMINLLNVGDKDIKEKILGDELYQAMMQKDDLTEWMLACSGSLEQFYMNTCSGAAASQMLLSRVLILPQAIILAEDALNRLVAQANELDPISNEYLAKRIEKERAHFASLREDLSNALEKESLSSRKKTHFTKEWSRGIQRLGLLTDSEKLAHPTKKIIKNHWLLSAILMFPVVLFQHLFGISAAPKLEMRIQGSTLNNYELLNLFPNPTLRQIIFEAAHTDKDVADSLWKELNSTNGFTVGLPGHMVFIKAIVEEGQQVFLVSDPKEEKFHKYTKEEIISFLKKQFAS